MREKTKTEKTKTASEFDAFCFDIYNLNYDNFVFDQPFLKDRLIEIKARLAPPSAAEIQDPWRQVVPVAP